MPLEDYIAEALKSKTLHPDIHKRLIERLVEFSQAAGIPTKDVCRPLLDFNPPDEVYEWVKSFKQHSTEGVAGLVVVGKNYDPDDLFSGIAGVMLRNFTAAKLVSFRGLFDSIEAKAPPTETCVLIPNYFQPRSQGSSATKWEAGKVLDFLRDRKVGGQQTVLHVHDLDMLEKEYGSANREFLERNFTIVRAD